MSRQPAAWRWRIFWGVSVASCELAAVAVVGEWRRRRRRRRRKVRWGRNVGA
jgi:peptidoglycan/LPS O-acetylase OafA/YrhL